MLTYKQRKKIIGELENRGRGWAADHNGNILVDRGSWEYSIRDAEDAERWLAIKI